MDYYEGVYTDKEFDITFDLRFNLTDLLVCLEGDDRDIYNILSKELKKSIIDYVYENYSHYFDEMEEGHHKQMLHLIRNKKI